MPAPPQPLHPPLAADGPEVEQIGAARTAPIRSTSKADRSTSYSTTAHRVAERPDVSGVVSG